MVVIYWKELDLFFFWMVVVGVSYYLLLFFENLSIFRLVGVYWFGKLFCCFYFRRSGVKFLSKKFFFFKWNFEMLYIYEKK